MINLNFNTDYKKIKVIASDKKVEVILTIKYTLPLLLKLLLFEVLFVCISPGILYLQNGSVDFSEAIIPTLFSIIFLLFITQQKKYFSIYPFKNKAEIKQSFSTTEEIKWKDAILSYEINYSSEGEIINVLLIAKSESKKIVQIFAFPDLETFETFREIYNSKFASNVIQE
jgi:hypothetical protein